MSFGCCNSVGFGQAARGGPLSRDSNEVSWMQGYHHMVVTHGGCAGFPTHWPKHKRDTAHQNMQQPRRHYQQKGMWHQDAFYTKKEERGAEQTRSVPSRRACRPTASKDSKIIEASF